VAAWHAATAGAPAVVVEHGECTPRFGSADQTAACARAAVSAADLVWNSPWGGHAAEM